jgi:hypothetical protein
MTGIQQMFLGGVAGPSGPLIIGVQYTFTTYGQTGPLGPSQSQANSYWSSTPEILAALTVTNGVNAITLGAGTYTIDMLGASGGAQQNTTTSRDYYGYNTNQIGGIGARIQATFTLSTQTTVYIFVGQQGTTGNYTDGSSIGDFSGSGGGATCIYIDSSTPVAIAGGGGGCGGNWDSTNYGGSQKMWDASNTTQSTGASGLVTSSSPTNVIDVNASGSDVDAFSAGSWNGTLRTSSTDTLGYGAALNSGNPLGGYVPYGATSGRPNLRTTYTGTTIPGTSTQVQSWGGFGGGGAGFGNYGSGGGGGGYSGGNGWRNNNGLVSGINRGGGGGGSSYTNGTYISGSTITGGASLDRATYYGSGYFKITKTA